MNAQEELSLTRAYTVDVFKNVINKLVDLKLEIALDETMKNKLAKYQKIDGVIDYIREKIE